MRRQNSGRPYGGYRGHGNHGDSGSSDGLTQSSSSDGSNKQPNHTRPVIRPSSKAPFNRVRTPEQLNDGPNQLDSPLAPVTPGSEQTSFTLNGHQINETYKPRTSPIVRQPNPSSPRSPAPRADDCRQRPDGQSASNRPPTRNTRGYSVEEQEFKVKILGIPKRCWTKDVYFAVSRFGTVTRIEMEIGSRDNNAWVIFQ